MIIDKLYSQARTALFTASFVLTALSAGPVLAAAPMAKTNDPGFYRIMLGDFEVTALNDGTTDLPVDKILQGITPEKVDQALAKSYLKSPLEESFNQFLINTGSKLVLIDTGAGTLFSPTLGRMMANLKASGYLPEQVDEIYITHFHGDHIGGLVTDGHIAFPNAVVRADKRESDYWLSQANMEKAPAEKKGGFQAAAAMLTPYISAGKFKPFEGAVELVPGVKALPSAGHTPGHSSYVVESQGQTLVLIGDLIHVGAVQFDNPSVTIAFDSDSKAAYSERRKVFTAVAKQGSLIGGAHLQFPGLGHLRENEQGFQWIPVNFTQIH